MDKREKDLKEMVHEFALWERKLVLLSSVNLNDLNLFSEHYAKELLNIILNYKFINANSQQGNSISIDLIDRDNRTAVQVSSTKTSVKIQKTLNGFKDNGLSADYDRLIFLILGKKQKTYTGLKIPTGMNFDINTDIIDFDDLLKVVNFLPTVSISKIVKIFKAEKAGFNSPREKSVKDIKKSMALKKKLKKDLEVKLPRDQWDNSRYEPWIKFKYHNLILRDPEDKCFPEVDPDNCSWLKVECWNFYERGLEFISLGGDAVFDEYGYWDILKHDDPRASNPKYETCPYNIFTRLEYVNIVAYDLEPDQYYSSPTIYCPFHPNDQHPFSEILHGHAGSSKSRRWTFIFDKGMRRKTDWET